MVNNKIARVFPRKTSASPTDNLCFFDYPPQIIKNGDPLLSVEEIHVSVTYTYDMKLAEELAFQWDVLGKPVKMGGPAFGKPAGIFVPGMYLRKPYIISSRGCPNHCWFCYVHKRQGGVVELEIKDGSILQDDNILGCSEPHIRKVFEMLGRQKENPVLSGGVESKLLKPWHVELFLKAKVKQMFFAYDTPDDYEPLVIAGKMLKDAGYKLKSKIAFCYCLIGYKNDTFKKQKRE